MPFKEPKLNKPEKGLGVKMEVAPEPKKEQEEKLKSQIEIMEDKDGKIDLVVTEGDNRASFKDFMPSGVALKTVKGNKDDMEYDLIGRNVFFAPAEINSVEGRLALLHEVGHAISFAEYGGLIDQLREFKEIRKRISVARYEVSMFVLRTKDTKFRMLSSKEKRAYLDKKMVQEIKALHIPKEKLAEYIKFLAQCERRGWAEGLKLYRKIKKEKNIDLFEGIKNKVIIDLVKDPLKSYERICGELLPEQQFKLFLVKKFSEEDKKESESSK